MLSTPEQVTIRAMIREHQRAVEALSKLVGNGVVPARRKRRSRAEMLAAPVPALTTPVAKSTKVRKRRRRRTKAEMLAAQARPRLESGLEAAE